MAITETSPASTNPASTAVDSTTRIADPGPLGLAAFAATTFALSSFNAGLLDEKLELVVLPLALFYGGLTQLLAGMWEFRKGNTFGATAFGSYGAFWLSFAFLVWFFIPTLEASHVGAADVGKAVGLYLLVWTIFTGYMLIASLRTNIALVAVFLFLFLTFLLLTIGDLGGSDIAGKIGGWLGLLTAVAAWYASAAVVTNATAKRTVLPVGPRS